MMLTNKIKAVTGLYLGCLAVFAQAAEFYVAPAGSDTNPGTQDAPLATILAARDALRDSGKLGQEPCSVILESGVYRLSESLTFSPLDSGRENAPVVYRAAEGARVVVTGAQEIHGKWELWQDGIYRTQVGSMDAIDQLFVNGERQVLARYPDLGAGYISGPNGKTGKAGHPPYDGCTPDAWSASKAKEWADPTGAFLHGMHSGLWGSQHYRVLGKSASGQLKYEGGWQNNRWRGPHALYRMVENVFEELDAPGEWFHDQKSGWLYYKPATGVKMETASFEVVLQMKHLFELYGSHKTPVATMDIKDSGNGLPVTTVKTYETTQSVKHIRIEGIHFTGTTRTFMETIEPLLRSDWSVYRGGAIHLRGTEGIVIEDCSFYQLGGNAVFVDGYNRKTTIRGNHFVENGASDVQLVGSFAAVRDPSFSYGAKARPLESIDTEVGPKSEEYPADCSVEDNLMTRCGRFEKQTSGVNISMSSRITVRHNTISHTPRAAINICDGTWGGHIIEGNDCFETVLETHDHGAFNSWGRDRIWHSANPSGPRQKDKKGVPLISHYVKKYPDSPYWDAYQTTYIRDNRMHCDHGWGIDLDDGSTNYEITNNLALSGGIKTREGYKRIVKNNIMTGQGYTCNVPYPKPTADVFEHNIVWSPEVYRSTKPALWGGIRNLTFVHNPNADSVEPAVALQKQTGDDADSLYGNAQFIDPDNGDFSISLGSPALKVGFKNFSMTDFGVRIPKLKALAATPPFDLPKAADNRVKQIRLPKFMGATIKTIENDAELSATGMFEQRGTMIVELPRNSPLAKLGFEPSDVILKVDGKRTDTHQDFIQVMKQLKSGKHTVELWRNQTDFTLTFSLNKK